MTRTFFGKIKAALSHPYCLGYIGALLASPYSLYSIKKLAFSEVTESPWLISLKVLSPLVAFNLGQIIGIFGEATYFLIKHPSKSILRPSGSERPLMVTAGTQDISSTLNEWLLAWKHNLDITPTPFIEEWSKKHTVSTGLIIARRYFALEKYDLGMEYVRHCLDLLGKKRATCNVFDKLALSNVHFACWLGRTLAPHDPSMYMFSSAYSALTNPQKAWYFSELGRRVAVAFNSPFTKEMYVFHALLASAQGRSDEEQAWKDAVQLVRQEPVWERLGETRTIVRRLADSKFFANTFIFKERPDLEALTREKDACEKLAKLIPEATVPKPLYLTKEPEAGLHYLVLRYLPGETLQSQLARGEYTAMPKVIQTLAQIHARFPADHLPKVNLEDRIEKLAIPECPPEVKLQIKVNYAPVLAAYENVPWVWNKDAHPENWQISDKIGVLDCEGEQRIPATFDLANLLEYDDSLSPVQRQTYVREYAIHANTEGKPILENPFVAYYNSVIHRMLCFASAWSAPERSTMLAKRARAIQRGLNAIVNIEQECTSYFARYVQQYCGLTESLTKLKSALDTGQPSS